MPDALYIHIPFCNQICTYCDFAKIYYNGQARAEYISSLHKEIELYSLPERALKTVYFGGGTPSSLSLEELKCLFEPLAMFIGADTECTFEANPESLTMEKLVFLKKAGVNRLSIGVQTFQSEQLLHLGRTHTQEDVITCIENAKLVGFDNINIDFIYALPEQTLDEVKVDIVQFLALDITHISTYALIVEPHTIFGIGAQKGWFQETDEGEQFEMYQYIMGALQDAGYKHYEVSNFSKSGFESKHNLTYWDSEEYYGVGLGAHGYVNGERYGNTRSINKYIMQLTAEKLPIVHKEMLTKNEQMEEFVFLGLRKREGINTMLFFQRFGIRFETIYGAISDAFIQSGKLENEGAFIRLCDEGIFTSNEVLQAFLLT